MTPAEAKAVMEPLLMQCRSELPGRGDLVLSMTWVDNQLVVAVSLDPEADVEGLCNVLGVIAGRLPAKVAAEDAAEAAAAEAN